MSFAFRMRSSQRVRPRLRTDRAVADFLRVYLQRLGIGVIILLVVVAIPPASVEAKIAAFMALPIVLLVVQAVEEVVRQRRRSIGDDPRVPLHVPNEQDVRDLRREADRLLSFDGDSSAFRSSAQIANQTRMLEATESGRAALISLLEDPSPVVRIIAAEAVMNWDVPAARDVLAEIVAEPAYYDWILERATSDLARLGEEGDPA